MWVKFIYLTILPLLFGRAISLSTDTPKCYFPDGSLEERAEFVPCNPTPGAHSMCCATNGRNASTADLCLSNGLCAGVKASGGRVLGRTSCTDKTWKDPACVKVCMGQGSTWNGFSGTVPVMMCQDGKSCCGSGDAGESCCREGQGSVLPVGVQFEVSSSSSSTASSTSTTEPSRNPTSSTSTTGSSGNPTSSTSTTGSLGNQTSSPPAPEDPLPTSPLGTSNPIKIAIGVSVPLVIISLLATGSFLWYRHKRKDASVKNKMEDFGLDGPAEIGSSDARYEWSSRMQQGYYYPQPPESPRKHHVNVHEVQ